MRDVAEASETDEAESARVKQEAGRTHAARRCRTMDPFPGVCNAGRAWLPQTGRSRNRYLYRTYGRMMLVRRNGDIAPFRSKDIHNEYPNMDEAGGRWRDRRWNRYDDSRFFAGWLVYRRLG